MPSDAIFFVSMSIVAIGAIYYGIKNRNYENESSIQEENNSMKKEEDWRPGYTTVLVDEVVEELRPLNFTLIPSDHDGYEAVKWAIAHKIRDKFAKTGQSVVLLSEDIIQKGQRQEEHLHVIGGPFGGRLILELGPITDNYERRLTISVMEE